MLHKNLSEDLPNIQKLFIQNTLRLLDSHKIDKSTLAERLKMSRTLVYKYLSGKTLPSIAVIDRFAKALDTTAASLLSETSEIIEYNRVENEKLKNENANYKSYFLESRKDLYKLINKVPEEDSIVFRIEFYNLLVKYIGQGAHMPSTARNAAQSKDSPLHLPQGNLKNKFDNLG